MKTGSLSEYAAHARVSPAYVTKLKKQGRIVMVRVGDRDLVNFEMTDRLIANTADQGRSRNGENAKPQPPAPLDSPASEAPQGAASISGGGSGVDVVFRRAQAQERVFSAKTAELQYRKAVGELVDRATTERAVFDLFRMLRDHTFRVPQRAAARVIDLVDLNEIERVLAEELRSAFDAWEQRASERLAAGAK